MCVHQFSISGTNSWPNQLIEKGKMYSDSWFQTVSLSIWDCGKAEHQSKNIWWSKTSHLIARMREEEEGTGLVQFPSMAYPTDWEPPISPHLLNIPQPPYKSLQGTSLQCKGLGWWGVQPTIQNIECEWGAPEKVWELQSQKASHSPMPWVGQASIS
jgi:hypothetical protein